VSDAPFPRSVSPPPVREGTTTDAVDPRVFLPVVKFVDEHSDIPFCREVTHVLTKAKSPCIPVVIEDRCVPVLLDTGADVSAVSAQFVHDLMPERVDNLGQMQVCTIGQLVPFKGPVTLKVEVCSVKLDHPFYYSDDSSLFIAGIDLISAAALTIRTRDRCVFSELNADVSPEFPTVLSPASTADRTEAVPVTNDSVRGDVPSTASDSLVVRHRELCVTTAPSTSFSDDVRDGAATSTSFSDDVRDCAAAAEVSEDVDDCQCRIVDDCVSDSVDCSLADLTVDVEPCRSDSFDVAVSDCGRAVVDVGLPETVSSSVSAVSTADDVAVGGEVLEIDSCSVVDSVDSQLRCDRSDDDRTYCKVLDCQREDVLTDSSTELPEHVNVLFLQTVENSSLASDVVDGLKTLLLDHSDTFAKSSADLGHCPIQQHDIDTGGSLPIRQSPRRPPLAAREAEDEILDEMLQTGVIEPSISPWASPVCLVRKKDGTFRFCVDYRRVNAVSKKDAYPVPDIQDALDHLRGARYFATFDLLSGYWQLGLTERAKERSAFCTRRGLFQFTRMPFGLFGAPSTFCRLMEIVLSDLKWRICLCYLDDIIIYARSPQELLQRLRVVLDRLRQVGLKVKPTKCVLFQTEIQFLGHQVSENGVEPLPDKIEAIQNWPTPHCIRDVRAFYRLASYYRKFVRDFALIAEPLSRLTRKQAKFEWTREAQEAFDRLKKALVKATSLAFLYPNRPCILDTDASDVAVGAVLSQKIDGVERPIAFFSRVLNDTQRRYCTTRRELLAVIVALQHFRHYLLGTHVILRTDHHSLKWLRTFKRPEGILARWVETLAKFDFEIEHRPGRLHNNVDGVSRPFCKQCLGKSFKIPWVEDLDRVEELVEPLGATQVQGAQVHLIEFSPQISQAEMMELQYEDPCIGQVLQWLEDEYEPSSDELRAVPLETQQLWCRRPLIELREVC